MTPPGAVWLERHQVALYLGAIAVAVALGLSLPHAAARLTPLITPTLGLLLFATFLGIPFTRLAGALTDSRFLATLGVVNFVVVPAVVFGLSRFVAADAGLLAGVLLVLLTPCVDYVVAFTGIAGGARERMLAATPLLLVAQFVLLPGYLLLMGGADLAAAVEPAPFVGAFLLLIVLPLALAVVVQLLARRATKRRSAAAAVESAGAWAMVPLMMLTLAVVVASQVAAVGAALPRLASVVPLFVAFAIVMVVVGMIAAWLGRVDVPGSRAVVLSGVTRNSLVVLPLALALPASFDLSPLVVVTQTLVELVILVVLVAALPHIVRTRSS